MSGRALVTGARGFVGRVLCDHLSRKGWDVIGAVAEEHEASPAFRLCDITRADDVDRLFEWARDITHVFHLAAVTFVPDSHRDPTAAIEVNLVGTIRLLQAAEANAPHANFIYIGSSDAYGPPQRLPIDETHPLAPANPYAISKAAADSFCAYFHGLVNMDVIRLRPFNHSGPGQTHQFVLSSLAHQVAKIEAGMAPPVLRVGNLASARDFLHVTDVVRAYELAALEGAPGEAYNICSGRSHTIQEAVDILCSRARLPIEVTVDSERVRAADVPEVRGSYEKFGRATGWHPEIPFETLIEDLLRYWRGQMELDL